MDASKVLMLDRQSLIVSYDEKRGEPRGKPRKAKRGQDVALPVVGDCIDCDTCVQVCPTGIDIRQGLQMECVACTQCIDACDSIMDRLKRPRGLIRYSSQAAMEGQKLRLIRLRVLLYPLLVCVLLTGIVVFLATKPAADIEILRTMGRPFSVMADGQVETPLRVKITNRSDGTRTYRLSMPSVQQAQVIAINEPITLEPGQTTTEAIQVVLPYEAFTGGRLTTKLWIHDGHTLESGRTIRLQGPTARPAGLVMPPVSDQETLP